MNAHYLGWAAIDVVDSSNEDVPVLTGLVILQLVLDHANHNVVADEPSGIHDLLGFYTESSLGRDLLTQQVTSG